MSQPSIKYDEISDTLTVCFEPGVLATGIELTEHIILRLNQQQQVVSLVFLDYSVLAQITEMGSRNFPLTGLAQLPSDQRETVLHLLQSPLLRQFLQISAYTPTIAEAIPVISLHPIAVASA